MVKENEVYVTERGVYVGIQSISGNSAWVKVLSQRDGKVILQKKELIVVDSENVTFSDPITHVRTPMAKATAEQIEEFQRLLNVKGSVSEDKAVTRRADILTRKDAGLRRI